MDEEPRPGVHNIEVNTAQLWANVTWSGGVWGGGGEGGWKLDPCLVIGVLPGV